MMNDRYLTLDQLSAKLGNRSRSSIYRDIEAKRIPQPIKLGVRLYWRESDIDELMSGLSNAA
ncbi:MAG: AlpA family phage regulatory protein [Pseudomonadota bacterium]